MIHKYPYTNFHELNLDWIVGKIKELETVYTDIPGLINDTIEKMIADGTLVLSLTETYDPATEALTLTIGGTNNG